MASESSVEFDVQEVDRLYKLVINMERPTQKTKDEWIAVHRKLASLSLKSYLAAADVAKEKKRVFEKVR